MVVVPTHSCRINDISCIFLIADVAKCVRRGEGGGE